MGPVLEHVLGRWHLQQVERGRAEHPEGDLERVSVRNHVIHFRQAQLLDDLHGLEGIDLRSLAIAGLLLDQGQQRRIHILAVGDRRLGDAAPQLLDQDLAASLPGNPRVVGRKADSNSFSCRPQFAG